MQWVRLISSSTVRFSPLFVSLLLTSLFPPIGPSLPSAPFPRHRHRIHRPIRSFAFASDPSIGGRHRRLNSLFPTAATPIEFHFTAASYNLTVYENAIGQRAVASNPANGQMVGVWLPRGYNQITFRILGDDKQNARFTASAKRMGNFAFLHLEHRDQMDVLNRELQAEFTFTIRATAKRKRANPMETSATVYLRVLDENDNPPMFKELSYRVEVDHDVPLHQRLLRVEGFDADEGLNGALSYSLITPSSFFFIEPMTGWLRNFAPLNVADRQIPESELQLEVLIEDRASRLFRHGQRTAEGAESPNPIASIRNKAKVQIVIRRKEAEKPKLSFRLLPFGPFLSEPSKIGTVRINHSDADSIILDISPRQNAPNVINCAWLERISAEEIDLWICPPFPEKEYEEKLQIRLIINRISDKISGKKEQIGEETVEVWADLSKRDLRLEEVPKVIDVNESLPVGAFIWQFVAVTNWPKDRREILFKLLQQNDTEFPFRLNDRSGQLRLAKSLYSDRTKKVRRWNVTVMAQHKHIQSPSVISLQLRLRRANIHCPKFVQIPLGYRIELSEKQLKAETSLDRIIWQANASDEDEGENGQLIYKMAEDAQGMFDIDSLTGELRLVRNWSVPTGVSSADQLIIRVLAIDRGWPFQLQTQLQLVILQHTSLIRDNLSNSSLTLAQNSEWLQSDCEMDNNFQPKFVGEQRFLGEILETAPIGTTIGTVVAEDEDSFGPNAIVQYFTMDDGEGHFDVEPFSGRVFVRSARLADLLEGAKGQNGHDFYEHVLEIVASDMAIHPEQRKTARQHFRIRIRDVNTHSPVFDQSGYRISLAEGNSPGIELLQLRASDGDLGKNGRVEFRLAVETDLLSVDPDSGLVRAERTFDREELGDRVTVPVMALDRGTPSRATFANLTILLTDQNDEAPQCGKEMHRFSVAEDAPNGQLVGCLDAYDSDEFGTSNSQIRFELAQSDANGPFRVHAETGCLFLDLPGLPLDFEQRPTYNLSVRLKDMGKPPLEAVKPCQVQILLEDVEENAFPPQFNAMALEASVEENAPAHTEVTRVHAEDPEGATVRYRLVAGNGLCCFQIDPKSGVISTKKELDHELQQHYWLTVRAEDTPFSAIGRMLRAHLQLFIRVLNLNDRLPLFSQPIYRIGIAENSEENKVVLKVEATDGDDQWAKPSQQSDRLRYSILKGNPQAYFQIDEHSGYIVTSKRRLDRETQSEHELIVQACDQGQLCSTATVLVTVSDLNDNAPAFELSHFAHFAIPADRQGMVGRVIANDSDIVGSKLRFWMDSSADKRVQMDERGRLFAKEPLGAGTELEVAVWAEDGGVPPLRANATVRLIALGRAGRLRSSNRAPYLLEGDEWRHMEVPGEAPPGTVVGIVRAEDADRDPLWWTITSTTPAEGQNQRQDEREPFAFRRVDAGAELIVAEPLLTGDGLMARNLVVLFSVTDGVDTINDKINVRIRQNSPGGKLRPKFVQSLTMVELGTHLPVGFVLFQANAKLETSDDKEEENDRISPLQYSLHSSDDIAATAEVFRVDPSSGNVILARPLPERLASPFTLTISASLFESADAADFTILKMNRKVEKEKAPQFISCDGEKQQKSLQIDENFSVGTLLHIFEAVNSENGEFGQLTYSLLSGNEVQLFSLNGTTGELKLAKEVPTDLNEVILTVRATDTLEQNAKWSECELKMNFVHRNAILLGGKLGKVIFGGEGKRQSNRRSEAMESANSSAINPSSVFFALNGECSAHSLAIHFATGRITLTRNLIMEKETFNCSIELKKTNLDGEEKRIGIVPLIVQLFPNFPILPRFDRREFFGTISENCQPGSPVLLPNSSAPLLPSLSNRFPLKSAKFRLLSPFESHFMIDAHSGLIRCVAPIDAEKFSAWHFFILAQQSLPSVVFPSAPSPSSISVVPPIFTQPSLVLIKIININDNAPAFERSFYEVEVGENAPNGTKILKLFAEDADRGQFGSVSYSLEEIELVGNKSDKSEQPSTDFSDLSAHFLLDENDGWLSIGAPLDFERIRRDRFFQLTILARDGGEPPLENRTKVRVKVRDENDNAPRIGNCTELSALVQEGVPPGHTVLSLSVSDADSAEGNAAPFRVEITGEGAEAFTVDSLLNLITDQPLEFANKQHFHFQIRAFDAGGLASVPCQLRIRVLPQSRHAPEVRPLFVHLMALHGEFLGGPLGRITASDRDLTDRLRFSISNEKQLQFSVNPENGELVASGDLLSGIFRLNVSVTDGKFITNAPITVDVVKVDQEKMDNSLTIRLKGIGAEKFVSNFMHRFSEIVARLLSVKTSGVFILSLQEIYFASLQNDLETFVEKGFIARHAKRKRRSGKSNGPTTANSLLDLILVVQRSDGTVGPMPYHRPSYVKQRLEAGIGQLEKEMPELKVLSIITELCRRDTCLRGECRDRLWMDNGRPGTFQSPGSSAVFVGPSHVRSFECICRQGYAGIKCDIPANKCSKELCKRVELCVPSTHLPFSPAANIGFSCACPPGFRGTACSDRICDSNSFDQCHRHHEAISLFGSGYFELRVALSVESRMELAIDFRTVSPNAVLMFGKGLNDYQMLQIEHGMVQYSWDCGTGDGIVKIGVARVDDGQWHQIQILRIGRLTRLTLDDKFRVEGTSPAGSDVLNLFSHGNLLLFGARVEPSLVYQRQFLEAFNGTAINKMPLTAEEEGAKLALTADDLRVQMADGMVGCIGRISMDGTELPKTGQGFRMFNAAIGCEERTLGPCLSAPCQNGGQCVPSVPSPAVGSPSKNGSSPLFTCHCPQRFTGARCEIDLNACVSKPCPGGIPCHNLYGDFHCSCPPGLTGKKCQLRGDWDPCVTASCGPNGKCVRQPQSNSFVCQCANGFSGRLCTDIVPTELASEEREAGEGDVSPGGSDFPWAAITAPQLALLVAICLLTLFCTAFMVIFCQSKRQNSNEMNERRNRRKKKGRGTEEKPRNGTTSAAQHHPTGRGTAVSRDCHKGGEDPASNPLVPRETAAPGQGTSDRPPPPLPPRHHRRSANGHNSALPTVEVRPMPIGERKNTAGEDKMKGVELAKTPPLPPPRDSSERQNGEQNQQNGQRQNESYGRKIDRACSAAADTQKQKATSSKKGTANKTMRDDGRSDGKGKDEGKSTDYLTMKPVHRAKPFRLIPKASRGGGGENPPPPPMHRTPLLNMRGRRSNGTNMEHYDSPSDALDYADGYEENNDGEEDNGRGEERRGGGEEEEKKEKTSKR
ncbi:hypothetical protein niasHS_014981 [Heterodera schachtii]|uniref:Uncharacterized protein n=1 Tax=Heterodera schachtii TaxID=97005 RepID=A0ABD2I4E1_HETSC